MSVDAAVAALRGGGLAVFPTETVYGLGADARNPDAVARLVRVRGRDDGKPILVLVRDLAMVEMIAREVPPAAVRLAERFWPGPPTLLLPAQAGLPAALTAGTGTIGVRVSSHPLAAQLVDRLGGPLTAPSANPPGAAAPQTLAVARGYVAAEVAAYVDGGLLAGGASTVAVAAGNTVRVLRTGSISAPALFRALED